VRAEKGTRTKLPAFSISKLCHSACPEASSRERSEGSAVSSTAEEFLEGLEFGFGHVQILLGGFVVLFLHGELGFGEVRLHALLSGDDVAAEAVTGGGLLALEIIQRLRDSTRATVDVVVALLDFFGLRGFLGFGSGGIVSSLGVFFGLADGRLFGWDCGSAARTRSCVGGRRCVARRRWA